MKNYVEDTNNPDNTPIKNTLVIMNNAQGIGLPFIAPTTLEGNVILPDGSIEDNKVPRGFKPGD